MLWSDVRSVKISKCDSSKLSIGGISLRHDEV